MVLLIFVAFVLLCLGVDAIVQFRRHKKAVVQEVAYAFPNFFSENTIVVPKGLYFDKTHTWAFMDKDGMVKIGIDDFFPHVTGLLTGIKMKNSGETIKKNEVFLSIIRNGKQLNIKAPVSGVIKTQNKALLTNTSLINSFPYSDGWVYVIEPTNWVREIQFLFIAEKFSTWLNTEFTRLKDFLAVYSKVNTPEYAGVILQDGGALKDGVLSNLDPEIWEDFQTNFINKFK